MASNVTLTSLINTVRIKANNQRLTNSEITGLINSAWQELYDLLTESYNADYYLNSASFTSSANVSTYPLSQSLQITDFYKARGLDIQKTNTEWQELHPYMFSERNKYQNDPAYGYADYNGPYYRYRLQGNNLVIIPTPNRKLDIQLLVHANSHTIG
jgi:hypothetical protein